MPPPVYGMDVKWYSKYVFLVGAILSFADPITDILTLVGFYRVGHKTWFAVGLSFVVLPWVPYGVYYVKLKRPLAFRFFNNTWIRWFLVGFNPFSTAVARLKLFYICLKLKNVNETIGIRLNRTGHRGDLLYSQVTSFFEAVLESAPQCVIQLYVISVQDAPVSTIQMISLPVSFLSLVWTFTSAGELWNITGHPRVVNVTVTMQKNTISYDDICNVKHKVLFFVTHLFILSSRLFAIAYFTVSYKWWIIGVLMFHSMVIVGYNYSIMDKVPKAVVFFGKFCVLWIKDDIPVFPLYNKDRIRRFSNVLFVVENLVMILLFYFSRHSNTWYALPVTVCVCSFTVLGAIMRITHFYFLQKEKQVTRNVPSYPQLKKNIYFQDFRYCYESAV